MASQAAVKRPRGNPAWLQGQSGNPGGRPKELVEIKALAREKGPRCIEVLFSIVEDSTAKSSSRIAAAQVLLDRGFGKVAQPLTGPDGEGAVQITRVEQIIVDPRTRQEVQDAEFRLVPLPKPTRAA